MKLASEVTPNRNISQQMECVQLVAGENGVSIYALDQELDVLGFCDAIVKKEGTVKVNAQRLSDIIQGLPDGDISFEVKDKTLVLKAKDRKATLSIIESENPPERIRNLFKSIGSIGVVAGDLIEMIERTLFAVATNEAMPAITGVLFNFTKNSLTLVGTDTRRASIVENNYKCKSELKIIAPIKVLRLIVKHFDPASEIKISYSESLVLFESDGISLCSKLIDGEFPDYNIFIPKDNDKVCVVGRKELIAEINRALIFTDKDKDIRKVKLTFSKNLISVTNANYDNGEYEGKIQCDYDGEETTSGMNAIYLLGALDHLPTETVRFEFKNSKKVHALLPSTDDQKIIMPIAPIQI